ncbi:MAG TPA: AAA family ATPase [Caldilineaceae bacterium]|nr:AAA family ATPase [Caldilineaceae bacterium]
MTLFEQAHQDRLQKDAPLAARMRPRTLDEYVGQEHIIGPGRLLRRAIQADQLGSLIFYGPPGTGKTTLAQVIANTTRAHFIALNAVLSGVKDIREAIAEAQERAGMYNQRTILFVDEVHRFNKSQQDALLPWVENGTVILVGATTENPYFEVNKALVSRSRIFQLTGLTKEHLRRIIEQTLADPERGYGKRNVTIDEDAIEHLVEVANGDARAVLNALELAVETTGDEVATIDDRRPTTVRSDPPAVVSRRSSDVHITLAIAEESIQRRAVLYDKEGDYHFDTISAFIKSLRGSDPDAAMYWMAKMDYAGENARYIFRRMLIFAGEDVGMADPNAIQVVVACAQAFEQVGMPEGRFHLATAALYLATAKKSNTTFAFFDAIEQVKQEADSGVPNHLRDGNRDKEGFGHGEGYLYPHAYRDHWVAQQYLPTSLQGKIFYQPSDHGYEAQIQTEVARRREAQLAAMLEVESGGSTPVDVLTFSPQDPARERWLQRTISNTGERLAAIREQLLANAHLPRHGLVLDLKAGSGLITWEALRRVPEGGVYAVARTVLDADALRQLAERLPEPERPIVLQGELLELADLLQWQAMAQGDALRFDAIVGYNALFDHPQKEVVVQLLVPYLNTGGRIALAERVPRHTQRLHRLVDWGELDTTLAQRVQEAEEAIYADSADPMVNWDAAALEATFAACGLQTSTHSEREESQLQVSAAVLERWFAPAKSARPSYGDRLRVLLTAEEVTKVRGLFERQLLNQSVTWEGRLLYLTATRA